MPKKKLYECEVTFTYYAYVEDETEAAYLADDAVNDVCPSEYVRASEVTTKKITLAEDWTDSSLVYHNDSGDVSLREALNGLPE